MSSGPAPAIDPQILAALKSVLDYRLLLEDAGLRAETWELLMMEKESPGLLHSGDPVRITPVLQALRVAQGNLARDLKPLALIALHGAADDDSIDLVVAFVLVSDKGRQAAQKWAADPTAHEREAKEKIKGLLKTVTTYRQALATPATEAVTPQTGTQSAIRLPAAGGGGETVLDLQMQFPQVAASLGLNRGKKDPGLTTNVPAAAAEPVELPPGVDRDVLEDVHAVQLCRRIFEATHQKIEVWEVFCLVMIDGVEARRRMETLLAMKDWKTPEFMEGALGLFDRLLKMRAEHSRFVVKLRAYLGTLQVGRFDPETVEMALGFIVASARGRERAKQWLETPDRFKVEAGGRFEDLLSKTMKYQRALRQVYGG